MEFKSLGKCQHCGEDLYTWVEFIAEACDACLFPEPPLRQPDIKLPTGIPEEDLPF
jgi:hypothetical protein